MRFGILVTFVILVVAGALTVAGRAIAAKADNWQRFETSCAERGGTMTQVSPTFALCLTDDGRVVPAA